MRSRRHARLPRLTSWGLALALALGGASAFAQKIAVIAAPGASPVTKAQLAKIYLARSFDRRPLDLPESSALRAAFYRAATDSDLTQVRTAWARVMFTGRGEPPRELPDAQAMKKAVAADPLAIGYIDAAALDDTVRAVLLLP